jgi:NADPH:quinone reductase-like Zn-dependent oxidoreductase
MSETLDIPHPKPGEILVHMLSVPMHPEELGFTRNAAGRGLASGSDGEGVGIVVKSEGGWYGWYLLGKRMSCCSDPYTNRVTCAEHLCVKTQYCMPVRRDVTDDEASCMMVNSFTTLMFSDKIRAGHHKAAIQTAALFASAGC